jgi:hypothetical protein
VRAERRGGGMWVGRAAVAMTGLSFAVTVGTVLAFLAASRGWGLTGWMLHNGLSLVAVCLLMVVGTHLLRRGAGLWMLSRGAWAQALEYCGARSAPTLTVGRNEAGLNRYVAAEALRRLGRAAEGLALLDASHAPPWRKDTRQLLALARVEVLLDLGRADEAQRAWEALRGQEVSRAATAKFEAVRARL